MIILGLNDSNSAAAIMCDGELVAAAREERFDRIKFSDSFPTNAVEYCLKEAGITIQDVDETVFAWNPGHELEPLDDTSAVKEHKHFLHYVPNNLLNLISGHKNNKRVGSISQKIELPDGSMNIRFLPHHHCHAAGCFFGSPFEESVIITSDAYGDDIAMQIMHGQGNKLTPLATTKYPHSIGSVFAAVTQHLGFRPNSDEWKVMGLAPYGNPTYLDLFRTLLRFDRPSMQLRVNLDMFSYFTWSPRRFSDQFEEVFGPERYYNDPIDQRHIDMAHSFQRVVEEVTMDAIVAAVDQTGCRNLCLSGGCAMNSKLNGQILTDGLVDDLFVQPSADDGGACLGACLYYWNGVLNNDRTFEYEHDYWGPGYSDADIKNALDDAKVAYTISKDIAEDTAALIADGFIIGWFQGRMEFGQRALGNRSILADPRKADMKDKINACVKHREEFRPFAPSMLEEYVPEFFDSNHLAPFMQQVFNIKKDKQEIIPAVTHIDGSGRLQSVSSKTNPLYWNLIDNFRKLTGIPTVLNTSFNDNDEPIVMTPKDAIRTFFGTGIDVLCIGKYIVRK